MPRIAMGGAAAAAALTAAVLLRRRPVRRHPAPEFTASAAPALDALLTGFLAETDIPGASLAVVRDGRLLYACGYGEADRRTRAPFAHDALCRIASVTKPAVAAAVWRLIDQGRLAPDARAFPLLDLSPLPAGRAAAPHVGEGTVAHLLTHTAGWDRNAASGFDPFTSEGAWRVSRALRLEAPPTAAQVLRYMMTRLDFRPGTRRAYSNVGYCALGRIVERVTGRPFGSALEELVLAPLGLKGGLVPGALGRRRGEVWYHDLAGRRLASLDPDERGREVPAPHSVSLSLVDASGGLVGTAEAVARLADGLLGAPAARLFSPKARARMLAAPAGRPDAEGQWTLLSGWQAWTARPGAPPILGHWHTGSMPGSGAVALRTREGLSVAVLLNGNDAGLTLHKGLRPLLWDAARADFGP